MDKIGILTFHRAKNNGAKLQAYALQEVLSEVTEISIVDYRNEHFENIYYKKNSTLKKRIRKLFKWVLFFVPTYKQKKTDTIRNKRFQDFDFEYLKTSSKIYRANDIVTANSDYDKFIVGSDQVWNLSITHNDWNYLLEFADNDKKYSYAASFGRDTLSEDKYDRYAKDLMAFKSILVRENTGAEIIENLLGYKPEVVCDPVFLLSKSEWINKLSLNKVEKDRRYLLFVEVAQSQQGIELARQIAKLYKYDLIYLNFKGQFKVPKGFKNIATTGPVEFLNYILNADMVITTSFHALAFSLIFNVPFYYELNHNKLNNNSRITDLAKLFNVEDRMIQSSSLNVSNEDTIDWNNINSIIKEYSRSSKEILFKSLDVEQ